MQQKRYKTEQIINKLRESEVELHSGASYDRKAGLSTKILVTTPKMRLMCRLVCLEL